MKSCTLIILLLLTLFAFAHPIEDLICPDSNPQNCYPKIFNPTNQWQVVKEGQEIPGGLHVRVNIDTQSKEAKLLDPQDMPDSRDVLVADVIDEQLEQQQQQVISHKPNGKISQEDKGEFSNSVHIIQNFVKSPMDVKFEVVLKSLVSLDELSHDLDFGIKISDMEVFTVLLELCNILPSETFQRSSISQSDRDSLTEKALTIIAATLRNNPIALNNVLKPDQKPSFVINKLLTNLLNTDSAVLQKRLLGVISGLIQNSDGAKLFNLNDGQNKILIVLDKLSLDGKIRALQILDDLSNKKILKRDEQGLEEEELTADVIDTKFFAILQDKLVTDSNHPDFKKLFVQLVNLKQDTKANIKVDSDFLNWLVNEVERRKADPELFKRDNVDNEDQESFDKYMLRMRHVAFGNPMGYRKAFADEL